jgi:hypothetical protein
MESVKEYFTGEADEGFGRATSSVPELPPPLQADGEVNQGLDGLTEMLQLFAFWYA